MSACRPKNDKMIEDIEKAIKREFRYEWFSDLKVFYDGSPYCTKRDYVVNMIVGTSWNQYDTMKLREIIRACGGTQIIGGKTNIRSKREFLIDIAFDEKKRKRG